MNWIVHIIAYAVMVALIAGAITFLVIYILRYRKLINTESVKCPVYSCGPDKENTAEACQESTNIDNEPFYAYRINASGATECQSKEAMDQLKIEAAS